MFGKKKKTGAPAPVFFFYAPAAVPGGSFIKYLLAGAATRHLRDGEQSRGVTP
jgi:hypothetical protein